MTSSVSQTIVETQDVVAVETEDDVHSVRLENLGSGIVRREQSFDDGVGHSKRSTIAAFAMTVYAQFGLEPIISAAGTIAADATGAEAGYLTAGAAAGLTLSAAACLA